MIEKKTGIFEIESDKNQDIYLIGDIHGDFQCLIHCLIDLCKVCEITKVFNDKEFGTPNREYLEWVKSNNSVIVFCGDLIHRKRFADNVLDDECSDVFIIQMLLRLKKEAQSNGGDILIIAGNHEILNILEPNNTTYTSNKNLDSNDKYFNSRKFINEYILNSYAWIKISNILIAHGGLCSDYLRFLDNENIFDDKIYSEEEQKGGLGLENGDGVVSFVNDKYKSFFTNLNKREINKDTVGYNLFVKYDVVNKNNLNLFWCREWGYSGVDCNKFSKILSRVGCNKMVIAHCPQFVSPDYPKMINFECVDLETKNSDTEYYNIARIDLGMSRCFDYNKEDNFMYYLSNNYNRKMSVLKLEYDSKTSKINFSVNSVITEKISCIQYLLIKYGFELESWKKYNMVSNWLGFEYLKKILGNSNLKSIQDRVCGCNKDKCGKINFVTTNGKNGSKKVAVSEKIDGLDSEQIVLCLLDPILNCKLNLKSIDQFKSNFNKK